MISHSSSSDLGISQRQTWLANRELLLLVSLFLLELSIVAIPAAMHMKGERPFAVFVYSNQGMTFLCAITVMLIAGTVVVHQYLASLGSRFRYFLLIAMMNLVTVISVVAILEIIVRVGSHSYLDGEAFANQLLVPKNWESSKHSYQRQIKEAGGDLSYMVYDDLTGWTVGPERSSANGLYFSNSDGIRTLEPAMSFPKTDQQTEIVLVGDSFTFGEEVRYEETWGHYLGQMLGEKARLLNYGVPGFGLDQAYLRYEKNARQRKPKVVLFGFISDDLFRSMWVYPLLVHNMNLPFSKPRFVLRDNELTKMNMPPLSPDAVLSYSSVSELPFLHYQAGYRASDWEGSLFHYSYLIRLFASIVPEWRATKPRTVTDELKSTNTAILQTFIRSAGEAGSIPLVVYFPDKRDFQKPLVRSIGKQLLQEAGIAYIDPTPCLLKVNRTDRFLVHHYSPQSNAAVAKCLSQPLIEVLERISADSSS